MQVKRFSVTILMILTATLSMAAATYAQETVLWSFNSNDGNEPLAGVTFDGSGNLYGATFYGGADGAGNVYELSPKAGGGWTGKNLYSFTGTGTDGSWPKTSLVRDSSGNLYGTTFVGGGTGCGSLGCGTVFELTRKANSAWTEKTLHIFSNNGADGFFPRSGLIIDASGNLYGTTPNGGAGNYGTVFELTRTSGGKWTEKVLHMFDYEDGAAPFDKLIIDASGNLYGTTSYGGVPSSVTCTGGCGTVFELIHTAGGKWTEKVLHRFQSVDGANPSGGLIFDGAGNLHGMTGQGGPYNDGTVFELTSTSRGWKEKILHNFSPNDGDGLYPSAALVRDAAGNLYGTTLAGGTYGQGTVFELTPTAGGGWKEKILHAFNPSNGDGTVPVCDLATDAAGNLYGTTLGGGVYGDGTVFKIKP
jgi:uncharacterized repeat protein (TIGR03803 family)